jgi:capsular polysaccharide transport system permease protein
MSAWKKLSSIWDSVQVHCRVVNAVLLRDMRTRFGRSHLTFLVAIGWPLSHLLAIVGGFIIVNRALPFGTDSVVFISTGVLPYILCLYPMRMMGLTMTYHLPTLAFPIVHPIDLILARMVIETLTAATVVLIFLFILWVADVDILPFDLPCALLGMYASIFFGLSMGTFALILRSIFKVAGYGAAMLFMIFMYISSGVYFPQTPSTELMRTLLGLNPVYQLVLWVRSAYFEVHQAAPLDKHYILLLSAFLLLIGLFGERLFRGKVMKA